MATVISLREPSRGTISTIMKDHEWNDKAHEEQHLPGHGMLWSDSHGKTFSAQAEACGRANHPGEKAVVAAMVTHFECFRCPVR